MANELEKEQYLLRLVRKKRNEMLKETDRTMLPDFPIHTFDREQYREYRQYLRDIPMIWKQIQIKELKVMSFEEWKENKPIYRVVKK